MYYLITIRAHPTEVQVFEDFLTIFLPDVKKRKEYYYSVEKDDTTSRHLHAVIVDPAPDLTNFKKKFDKKIYKEFRQSLSQSATDWESFFDVKLIKKDEDRETIGYIFKEGSHSRSGTKVTLGSQSLPAPDAFITDCVKRWHTKERIDARKGYKHDTTLLSSKNFTSKVIDYVNQNEDAEFNDQMLEYRMIKDRYDFLNISKYQTAKGFRQLRIMYDKEYANDCIETVRQMYPDEECQSQDLLNDLKKLLFENPEDLDFNILRQKYYWIADRNFT